MSLKNIFKINNIYENNKKIGKKITFFNKEYEFYHFPREKFIENIKIESNVKTDKNYISIAAISKNEGPYIKEWIEYHKLVGVDRIYFYDNESQDNTKEVLKPYIEDGTVVYHYVEGKCMQIPVYIDAICRYKNNTKWLGIIDLDEFIVPVEKDNLKDFLKDYEKYPGIAINWIMFDSNGYEKHPEGKLIIEAYTRVHKNYRSGNHIKSIVNPKKVICPFTPHACKYKNFQYAVNENYEKIDKYPTYFSKKYTDSKIRINHYYSKSAEDYERKVSRGFADQTTKREAVYAWVNFSETTNDYAIQKYVPKLRKQMGMN